MQKLTIKPKPGMANACTEVGDSLLRGALDADAALKNNGNSKAGGECQPPAQAALSACKPQSAAAPAQAAARPTPQDPAQRQESRGSPERGSADGGTPPEDTSVSALLRLAESRHAPFMHAMDARASRLDLVAKFWQQGMLVGCIQAVQRAQDVGLAIDMLQKLTEGSTPTKYTVDMCPPACSVLYACLRCRTEPIVRSALSFCLLLLEGFGRNIAQLRGAAPDRRDVHGDQRRQRYEEARLAFVSLRGLLQETCQQPLPPYVVQQARRALQLVEAMQ